ncbi:MAG TPA: hypothetical protein VFS21_12310 [Roseiflexaceae bacterium]|nr:hypothetical protein [Roseiflexaceae bacterium]
MRDRPFEFRTIAILYTLLGIVIALTIHFVVLSSSQYNWLRDDNGPAGARSSLEVASITR